MLSLVSYAVIPLFLSPIFENQVLIDTEILKLVFVGPAVAMLLAALLIHRTQLLAPMKRGDLSLSNEAGFGKFCRISIVVWGLAESAGVLGLVGYLFIAEPHFLHSLLILSLITLWVTTPKEIPHRDKGLVADLARPNVKGN